MWLAAGVAALAVTGVAAALRWPRIFLDPLLRRMLHPAARAPRALPEPMASRAVDVAIPGPTMPMRAWLIRADGGGHGLAVFVHGWSSDGGRMAPLARHVLEAGISCLLVDLPGHGRTGRTAVYHAALMAQDLRALADYVWSQTDLGSAPVALVGYSFGGIGAIVAAAADKRWGALVVMATPVGPMAATEIYLKGKGIPARRLRTPLRRAATRIVGIDPDTLDGARHLPALDVPVLFVHGTGDGIVPHGHAESLYAATPKERAEILLVDGADHDGLLVHPEAGRRVAMFLGRALRR